MCAPCPDGSTTNFIFFLAVLLAVGVFSLLVWDNLEGARLMIPPKDWLTSETTANFSSKMPFHSITIRIVSSYLQVAGMLLRFDLTLPESVRILIIVEASSSSLSEQLLLFDCGSDLRDGLSVFTLKQVMSIWVIPITSVLACGIFWMAVHRKKSQHHKPSASLKSMSHVILKQKIKKENT